MSVLPMTWKEKTIDELCIIGDGNHSSKYPKKSEMVESGVPFIRGTNIVNGRISGNDILYISKEKHQKLKKGHLKEGDVLFTNRGEIGKVAIVDKNFDGSNLNSQIAWLRCRDGLLKEYLFHFLQSPKMRNHFSETKSGAALQQFTIRMIKAVKISYPSLDEQKRIVAILDEAFAGIDTAIANTEKNLANARELFESYTKSLFSKLSENLVTKNLGDGCENLDSKRIPITKSKRKSGVIPYYGASGVVDHVADYIFDEDLLLVSEDGANLLARTYPIAFSISGKTWVNNHAHVLRFDRMSSQRFIEYYLNSISLAPYVSGMAQPKLNQRALNSMQVPFPDDAVQSEIVEKFDAISAEVKRLEIIYKEKLIALSELKQSLLQKAFSGKLTAEADKLMDEAMA